MSTKFVLAPKVQVDPLSFIGFGTYTVVGIGRRVGISGGSVNDNSRFRFVSGGDSFSWAFFFAVFCALEKCIGGFGSQDGPS